jgi:hypothetical protein
MMFSATELIDDYLQAADALATAVDGLSPDETRARPIAGKWSVLEVVCHLADSEVYFSDRITRTIALDNPLLIGVDEKPYPERIQYQEQAIDEELSLIAAYRAHPPPTSRRRLGTYRHPQRGRQVHPAGAGRENHLAHPSPPGLHRGKAGVAFGEPPSGHRQAITAKLRGDHRLEEYWP